MVGDDNWRIQLKGMVTAVFWIVVIGVSCGVTLWCFNEVLRYVPILCIPVTIGVIAFIRSHPWWF